jgi:SAM-dependent methyltransferase
MAAVPCSRMRKWFVRTFWATHNDSKAVQRMLDRLMKAPDVNRGLNVGCGDTFFDQRIINFDVAATGVVQIIGDALRLPFRDGVFDLVISQEAVEHVPDPFLAVREMARVLRPGGRLYLQAPFIIGYHPGPEDYWRFTRAGMRQILEQAELSCERVERAVGSGTALYRIAVEFLAGLAAAVWSRFYFPMKAIGSIVLFPMKWMDLITISGAQSDRIPGGYYAVGIRRE